MRLYLILLPMLCDTLSYTQDCSLSIVSGYPNVVSPRCGENNGSIDILAIGSGQIEYKINDQPFTDDGYFDNLDPGAYVITMQDEECQITFSTVLENQAEIVIHSIESIDSECTEATGSISIDATGEGLQYQLNNETPQSTGNFHNLAGGNYRIRVFDNVGCEYTEVISIRSGSIALESISVEDSRCGVLEGRIVVNATAENTLEYRLADETNWQSSNEFSNLDMGDYLVEIRDQTGCIVSRNSAVRQILDYQVEVEGSLCTEDTGEILVTVFTDGNYDYSLNNGQFQNEGVWTNLTTGSYTIDIRSIDGGCIERIDVFVGETPPIYELLLETTDSQCTQNNGQLNVSATGEELSFEIRQGDTIIENNLTGTFQNLPIGSYNVRIYAGSADCFISRDFTINEINDIHINTIETVPSNCTEPTGSATIQAESNIAESLTYSVDGGIFQASNYFSDLLPGDHTLEIHSTSGCIQSSTFFVQEINDISITEIITVSPTDACTKDGILEIYAIGTDVEYSLDNANFQQSSIFDSLEQGVYIAYVRNSLGCEKQSGDIALQTSFTIANLSVDESTCNEANGSITITATGTDLTYSLDNELFTESNQFTDLESGNYTAYVKSGDCVIQQTFSIANLGNLYIDDVTSTQTICGEPNGTAEIFASADEPIQYSLDGINYQESSFFTNVSGGLNTAYIRSEINGCVISYEFEVPESFPITYELSLTPTICADQNGQITVNPSGGVGPIEYSIDNRPFQSDNSFTGLEKGEYLITIRDSIGCEVSQLVQLDRTCLEVFPTAIMPNNNGKNERFRLLYFEEVEILSYKIYNRWGNLMYEAFNFSTTDDDIFWNGEQEMPDLYATHVIYIIDGETREYAGAFQLIR